MEFCPHDGTQLPPPQDTWDALLEQAVVQEEKLKPGSMFGQYKIVRLLGQGGMASVYEAEHKLLGRKVAIKVLQKDLASYPEVVERFFQEARVVNQIRHPNILDITDFGEATDDTPPFMVMELLEGKDLAHIVTEKAPLDPEYIVEVGTQICEAMAAVHEAGVVHRDLKPDNIMLLAPEYRTIKLLDFGIVKFLATDKAFLRTATGQTLGTPEYMAPEQVRGRQVDARTDIYALGIILYEMATGTTPFEGYNLAEVFQKQLTGVPEPPSKVLQRPFDPALEKVILTCLEKAPENRYQSMLELAEALKSTQKSMRLSAPNLEAAAGKPSHRAAWIALSVLLILAAAGAVWFLTRSSAESGTKDQAASAHQPAASNTNPDQTKSTDTKTPAVASGKSADAGTVKEADDAGTKGQPTAPPMVSVETKPDKAAIYDLGTGRFVGNAPVRIPREKRKYQARLEGYEPMEFEISPNTGERLELQLTAKQQARTPATSRRRRRRRHARKPRRGHRGTPARRVDEYGTVDPFKKK